MTKAALSSVFYGKRERVIFLENFPIQKRKNWKKKIQKETHFITHKKE